MSARGARKGRGRRRVTIVLAALALACDGGLGPGEIAFEAFDPLPEYQSWWDQTRECLGIAEADMRRVRFFRVTAPLSSGGGLFPCDEEGTMCPAYWEWPHDIYLAPGVVRNELIVRHEMVHDLQQRGHRRDPRGRSDPEIPRCAFPLWDLPF